MEMIFTCDRCRFIFHREKEPEQCPNCSKPAVREADQAERLEYEVRLKASREW